MNKRVQIMLNKKKLGLMKRLKFKQLIKLKWQLRDICTERNFSKLQRRKNN